ncbi:MAG TPA: phosphatase PAP2 family protein [Methylomirabilota bacterium]|nr:phosphatase PAP2 family protein [Methylomirabilota bacterium]
MKSFFYKFSENILRIFQGYNLIWQGLAIIITVISVTSGFDWWYYQSTRSYFLFTLFFPAAILGFLVPVIIPTIFLMLGHLRHNLARLNKVYALVQASGLAWLISTTYKVFTGRAHPETFVDNTTNITHVFRFGFFRAGAFWGWPSSHTAVAFAFAATLIILYPRNLLVRYLAIFYALYIGIGVSITIHWFSDFAAGAIIGSVVGTVVGKSFFNRLSKI